MSFLKRSLIATAALGAVLFVSNPAAAQFGPPPPPPPPKETPWKNTSLDAATRADLLLKEMLPNEKLTLLMGHFGTDAQWMNFRGDIPGLAWKMPAEARPQSAGFVFGVPRLGIPNQWQADAGIGVASQAGPNPRLRTALPSGMATASTWDRDMAFAGGAMIGREARLSGFNVQLAGGVNLAREPRNGRNFEYAGEDPLLAGVMVGEQIRGIQSNHIISTVKHYAFNDQETHRNSASANISDKNGRESDLLAFQFAIEVGKPGAAMCSYNRVNSVYACENPYLLTDVLKTDFGFKGFVMSDWGATHSTIPAANAGLDQQSGYPFDKAPYFAGALGDAVASGQVSEARLDDMVRRVLWAMFSTGAFDNAVEVQDDKIDFTANGKVSQADAEAGMVLLKNEGALPLVASAKKIVILGGHADRGVISGGGSSQVYGRGGNPVADLDLGPKFFPGPVSYYPDSPVAALKRLTKAEIVYDDGKNPQAAAELAKSADVVIVFGTQWTAEGVDASLSLDQNGDALIEAVASANKNTVVVVETGGPVLMPWLSKTRAVLEAWYPGSNGGTAIARILTGAVSPSGRLPVTFPASLDQLPRPVLDGLGKPDRPVTQINYDIEGAAVGYKWFDKQKLQPLFAFGHGLTYSSFTYKNLKADMRDGNLSVSLAVSNTGKREAADVPQIYISSPDSAGWEAPKRLAGWDKVALKPGQSKAVTLSVDPRTLSTFDPATKTWRLKAGTYSVAVGTSADSLGKAIEVALPETIFDIRGQKVKVN
ncbi:beta-glucosidase [Asticcacaulis taihuensis]|uniref:Beta-glucosidase n=1 Tax=Asticcacaulis taihuensis TaxID=260084 RepID=A0A1G4TMZ7_9CAUL|nr:glycoside hydrolase family 3 C-terminal domain-containing protein [Asticcacaulis taihuensis]SCW82746.1 beta-glucosidase [Asticcacaulis taihuensis]